MSVRCERLFLGALLWMLCLLVPTATRAQSSVAPAPRLSESTCRAIHERVGEAIQAGETAGAVVVVANSHRTLFAEAYGHRQVEPEAVPMTLDTVFDLASLTKPIATACSVMKLVERGQLDLDAPVVHYLPEFATGGKDTITTVDLLLHQAGLIPDNAIGDYAEGPETAWQNICELSLQQPPGEKFAYTDVGFIVLGKLVERISGEPLDQFAQANLFAPLGMTSTRFNPPPELRARAAATERREGRWMIGEVHDPRAYLLGGVAGHAGLFSAAEDLVVFGQMLLGEGTAGETQIFHAPTIRQMAGSRAVSRGRRALGWDVQSPYSSNRGTSFSPTAFGHGGFTGTVMWVDPEKDLVFIFLANRLHPDGKGAVNGLAGKLATLIAAENRSE